MAGTQPVQGRCLKSASPLVLQRLRLSSGASHSELARPGPFLVVVRLKVWRLPTPSLSLPWSQSLQPPVLAVAWGLLCPRPEGLRGQEVL